MVKTEYFGLNFEIFAGQPVLYVVGIGAAALLREHGRTCRVEYGSPAWASPAL